MKGIFKAEFVEYKKLEKKIGLGLSLSNIRDENNIPIARSGMARITESIKNDGRLEKGDVLEFEAKVKEVAFEHPKNVKIVKRKYDDNEKEPLEAFFDLNKE